MSKCWNVDLSSLNSTTGLSCWMASFAIPLSTWPVVLYYIMTSISLEFFLQLCFLCLVNVNISLAVVMNSLHCKVTSKHHQEVVVPCVPYAAGQQDCGPFRAEVFQSLQQGWERLLQINHISPQDNVIAGRLEFGKVYPPGQFLDPHPASQVIRDVILHIRLQELKRYFPISDCNIGTWFQSNKKTKLC